METQEAISVRIRNEAELIGERAALIPQLAAGHLGAMALRGCEDEELFDAFRNVSGTLQLVVDYLRDLRATPITADEGPQDGAELGDPG